MREGRVCVCEREEERVSEREGEECVCKREKRGGRVCV